MSANIIKLIFLCIILTVLLAIAAQPLFGLFNLEAKSSSQQFAWGMGAGALIASLLTGIILLIKPYKLAIKKQTLFIGNLAFKSTDRDLRKLFSQCGEVFSIRLMTDRVTRKPRGYGFIEMDSVGAKKAMSTLNEQEFMGRELRVSLANEPSKQADE